MLSVTSAEFSRWVDVTELGAEGRTMQVSAAPEELRALARRFGVVTLSRLTADVSLQRISDSSEESPPAVRVDTSTMSPDEAAAVIAATLPGGPCST